MVAVIVGAAAEAVAIVVAAVAEVDIAVAAAVEIEDPGQETDDIRIEFSDYTRLSQKSGI